MQMTTTSKKKLTGVSKYPFIPDEILFYNILITLPVKSLLRFKCVSKQWKSMIEDPKFIQSNFICAIQKSSSSIVGLFMIRCTKPKWVDEYLYIPKESLGYLRIQFSGFTWKIGICNGLLCIGLKDGFKIYNPATCEFLYHPWPDTPFGFPVYGFGYDPLKNEYKVVQVFQVNQLNGFSRCMVYTLGSRSESWKDITVTSDLVSCLNHDLLKWTGGIFGIFKLDGAVYYKGAIHWLIGHRQMILSFDIHDEKFTLIQGPKVNRLRTLPPCFISKWYGCMCLGYDPGHVSNSDCSSIRVLKYELEERQNLHPRVYDSHVLHDMTIENLPTKSAPGCLGDDSKFLYWFTEGHLSLYSPEDTGKYNPKWETRERFPLPPGVDESFIFNYAFMHHIDNTLSLKTLLPLGSNQTGYAKNNSMVQARLVSSI